jgi:hypothetical protein
MVRSFWFVLSGVVGIAVAVVSGAFGGYVWLLSGFPVAFIFGLYVLWEEGKVRALYEFWNDRLVRPFAELGVRILVRILFYTVFVPTGRRRAERAVVAGQGSLWRPRMSLDPSLYPAMSSTGRRGETFSWRREYQAWASSAGNLWALSLLPLLLMLRFCSVPQEKATEKNNYTLF